MEVERVDPGDRRAVEAFHGIYAAVGAADAPRTFVSAPVQQIAALLAQQSVRLHFAAFLGRDAGRLVASGWIAGAPDQTRRHVFVLPRVLPGERRHGYGSLMLEHLERVADSDARSILDAQARWDERYGPGGRGSATVGFCERHGYRLGLCEQIRRLSLPIDPGRAREIDAEIDRHAGGYEIRAWIGPVPDQYLHGWAALEAAMSTQTPSGDLDRDRETARPDAVRGDERLLDASGMSPVGAVALTPDKTVVAYTQLVIAKHGSRPAQQSGTLVHHEHRGHRLGLAVKRAVTIMLQAQRPDIPAALTQTAVQNAPMNAINQQLGYQQLEFIGDFQKHLALTAAG